MSNTWILQYNSTDKDMIEIWQNWRGKQFFVGIFHLDMLPDNISNGITVYGQECEFSPFDLPRITVRLEVVEDEN